MPAASARSQPDERLLFERARSGPDGFIELYDRFFADVYSYVYYRTRNRTITEDVVAETFTAALGAIGRLEWRGRPLRAWLFRIAANELVTYYRKHRELLEMPRDEGDDGRNDELETGQQPWQADEPVSPERRAEQTLDYETALSAIARLPADQQEAIIMRYVNDLDVSEIALALDRTEGAVRALISRGLRGLRAKLACEGGAT